MANSAAVMMGLLEAFRPFYPMNDSYATTAIQHACDIPFLAGVLGVETETPCEESFDALFWFRTSIIRRRGQHSLQNWITDNSAAGRHDLRPTKSNMMLEWKGFDQLWRLRIPSLLCSRARGQSTRPGQKGQDRHPVSSTTYVTIRLIIFVSHEGTPKLAETRSGLRVSVITLPVGFPRAQIRSCPPSSFTSRVLPSFRNHSQRCWPIPSFRNTMLDGQSPLSRGRSRPRVIDRWFRGRVSRRCTSPADRPFPGKWPLPQ